MNDYEIELAHQCSPAAAMEQGQADRCKAAAPTEACLVDQNPIASHGKSPRLRFVQSDYRQQTSRMRCGRPVEDVAPGRSARRPMTTRQYATGLRVDRKHRAGPETLWHPLASPDQGDADLSANR